MEDQLFRFGRILDAQPKLNSLLSDYTIPADRRVALLDKVLEGDDVNQRPRRCLSRPCACCAANGPTRPSSTWPSWRLRGGARSLPMSSRRPSSPTRSAPDCPRCSPVSTASRGRAVARRPRPHRRPLHHRRRRGYRRLDRVASGGRREPAAGLTDTKPDRTTEDHPLTQGRKTKTHGRVDNLRF